MFKLRMTQENSGFTYRIYIFSQKEYEIDQQEYHMFKEKQILGQIWVNRLLNQNLWRTLK